MKDRRKVGLAHFRKEMWWRFTKVLRGRLANLAVFGTLGLTSLNTPVARGDVSSVRITPSQVMLGSLEYGGTERKTLRKEVIIQAGAADWHVLKVDLSRAPGVDAEVRRDGKFARVILRIEATAFTAGFPYGSYVDRVVRLETDVEGSPQILIPVNAFLSSNRSGRNFSTFVFQGRERWQGRWGTPNIAGSILAVSICLLTALWAVVSLRAFTKKWIKSVALVLIGGAVPIALYFLVQTYSRGAWVALMAGVGILIIAGKRVRRIAILSALLFFVMLLLFPAAANRLGSSLATQEDKSTGNRVLVWKGALQMIGQHPWTGVGEDGFGRAFKEFYQEPGHFDGYSTAVNDYLTWGSERGLPLLVLLAGIPLGLLLGASWAAWGRPEMWIWGVIAGLVALMVASWFSTLWFVKEWQVFYLVLQLVLFGYLIWVGMKESRRFAIRNILAWVGIGMGGASVLFYALSGILLHSLPTQYSIVMLDKGGTYLHCFEPRQKVIMGTILYFQGKDEEALSQARAILRPLASKGWRVVCADKLPEFDQVLEWKSKLEQLYEREPFFALGHREGGSLAWSLCAKDKSLFKAGAGCGFEFSELAENNEKPFLIYHAVYDTRVSINPFLALQKKAGGKLASPSFSNYCGNWREALENWPDEANAFLVLQANRERKANHPQIVK